MYFSKSNLQVSGGSLSNFVISVELHFTFVLITLLSFGINAAAAASSSVFKRLGSVKGVLVQQLTGI